MSPLESLWSAPNPESFTARRKDEWDWTLMIMVPDFVDEETFQEAKPRSASKLGELSAIGDPRKTPAKKLKPLIRQPVRKS